MNKTKLSDLKKCIKSGCNEPRHEDKHFCEIHWKERRTKGNYKNKW